VPRLEEGRVKTPEVIERMRIAGDAAKEILRQAGEFVRPGITTDDIDVFVHDLTIKMGGYPSPLNYHNYPKSVCTSVNEVICHGIPDSTVLQDGDICNIDITAFLGGVHGDTNATFLCGEVAEDVQLLVERTHEATMRAIAAVKPGRTVNIIGRVIESYARRFGYGVVRDFTGHGINTAFHSGLIIPHFDDPHSTKELEPGMTFTIEPMLTLGTTAFDMWDDGWTAATKDKSWTAQFEHTLVVREDGAEILTLADATD
jgi:methionyl aminopeptidase